VQGFDLLAQEVQATVQSRVALGPVGIEVQKAVMAFGEHGDTVDMSVLEGARKRVRVERPPNSGDSEARVKVEVHRPPRQSLDLWALVIGQDAHLLVPN
jgi:hypothetical protein